MNPQAIVDHLSDQIRTLSVELAIVKAERDELKANQKCDDCPVKADE